MAIWVMPAAVYALASDTLIGVLRTWVIATSRHTGQATLAEDDATPMAILGGLFLWLLRLALAPPSTMTGFRRWALEECPIAPGRKAIPAPRPALPLGQQDKLTRSPARRAQKPGKQARLLSLASQRHDLTTLPLNQVSSIANTIAAEVSLSPGTARRVRGAVRWWFGGGSGDVAVSGVP